MRLDDQVLAQVIQALGAVAGPDEGLRRRRAERYHCVANITITPAGVANPVSRQVKLTDVSATGVCIIDQLGMTNGNRFVIPLPRAGGEPIQVMCTVRQSRLTGAGGFRTGAEFTGEGDVEQGFVSGVSGVLAKAPGLEPETRIPARLAVRSGPGAGQLLQAVVRDLRDDVLSLHTTAQLAPGTALIIELNPGHPDRRVVQGVVRGTLAIAQGQFRLTVNYVVPPPPKKSSGFLGWLRGK